MGFFVGNPTGRIPRAELGPARGPMPAGLTPIAQPQISAFPGRAEQYQEQIERNPDRVGARPTGGGASAPNVGGGFRVDLLGILGAFARGVVSKAPLIGPAIAQTIQTAPAITVYPGVGQVVQIAQPTPSAPRDLAGGALIHD